MPCPLDGGLYYGLPFSVLVLPVGQEGGTNKLSFGFQAIGPQGTTSGPGGGVCVSVRDRQYCNWMDFGVWPMEEG